MNRRRVTPGQFQIRTWRRITERLKCAVVEELEENNPVGPACAGALAGTLAALLLSRVLARIAPGSGSPAI
jgi:hypothetical protein